MRTSLLALVVIVFAGVSLVGCSGSSEDAAINAKEKTNIDAGLKGMPAVDPSQSANAPKAMKKGGPPPPGAPGMGK